MRGGNDRLPLALAARLTDRIQYGSPVVRIEQDTTAVRAVVKTGSAHRTLSADRLICTVPFPVLRNVEIVPPLPAEKRRAIEELQLTSVARVFLQTRTRFWESQGLSGVVLADRPWSVFPRTPDPASHRGILESYSAGAEARRIAKIRESPLLLAVQEAAALFPELPDQFEGGTAKLWDEDEWARGAYTWFKPGQMRSLLPLIGRSEGRLLFAGEHASDHPGWMQGALASGVRAASRVWSGSGTAVNHSSRSFPSAAAMRKSSWCRSARGSNRRPWPSNVTGSGLFMSSRFCGSYRGSSALS